MSWAEIKKMNSELSDGIDEIKEQFGLEYVANYYGNPNSSSNTFTISGFNGFVNVHTDGTQSNSVARDDAIIYKSHGAANNYSSGTSAMIPLEKGHTFKVILGGYCYATVYSWGGGI